MSQAADSFDSRPAADSSRRAYQAPRLRDYGHVREITRSSTPSSPYASADGGSEVPYVYVS